MTSSTAYELTPSRRLTRNTWNLSSTKPMTGLLSSRKPWRRRGKRLRRGHWGIAARSGLPPVDCGGSSPGISPATAFRWKASSSAGRRRHVDFRRWRAPSGCGGFRQDHPYFWMRFSDGNDDKAIFGTFTRDRAPGPAVHCLGSGRSESWRLLFGISRQRRGLSVIVQCGSSLTKDRPVPKRVSRFRRLLSWLEGCAPRNPKGWPVSHWVSWQRGLLPLVPIRLSRSFVTTATVRMPDDRPL